jgi:hypothetical protein
VDFCILQLKGIYSMTTTDGTTPQAQTEQPAPSAPEGGDSSQEVRITKAEWDRVNSLLGRIPDLQGGRDIARQTQAQVSQLNDQVRPLLERAHALGAQNQPLNDALNTIQTEQSDADFRKAVFEIAQSLRGGTQPGSAGNASGVDMTAVLADYKLDPKDPYVAGKLAGQTFQTKEAAELAAARILRDKMNAPETNPSQQSASTNFTNPRASDLDAVYAEYAEAFKNPTQNAELMKDLEAKMKSLGG